MAQSAIRASGPPLRIVGPETSTAGPATPRAKRAKGEGTLYQATDGRWRGMLAWKGDDGDRSGGMCRARRSRRHASGSRPCRGIRRRPSAYRCRDRRGHLTRWLATSRADIRPATWRQRDQSMRGYAIPSLGTLRLDQVKPADIERMTSGMVEFGVCPHVPLLSPASILRNAFADAQRDGLVGRNVAALARPPRRSIATVEYRTRRCWRRMERLKATSPFGPTYPGRIDRTATG